MPPTDPLPAATLRVPPPAASRRAVAAVALACGLVTVGWLLPGPVGAAVRGATAAAQTTAESAMTWWKAAILGAVEGLTEYIPVSSTGHLLVVSRLLGLGETEADQAAANTYAIAIQFGAIVAVAGLFWRRFRDMLLGLVGRSGPGRHLLAVTIIAFVPAAAVGFLFDDTIEERLFGPWPIVAAWVVGGLLILGLEYFGLIPHEGEKRAPDHDPVLDITYRQALVVGVAQVAALWPGTSRSLATILGALLAGVGMAAAVEFSFILGFVTLTAASLYSLASDGGELFEQFGLLDPAVGLVFAFLAAVVAIKWLIRYLETHSLAIFGWYRLVVAAIAVALIAGDVI